MARLFRWTAVFLAGMAVVLFYRASADPSLQLPALALAVLAAVFWLGHLLVRRRPRDQHVLIDGSNVMHWKKGDPDIAVVRDVAKALDKNGYRVAVIFDANAGYKLADRYMNEVTLAKHLRIHPRQVMVSPKGQPADGFLLQAARDTDAPIVSNDRFRDWQSAFPEVAAPGRLIHGGYRDGAPYLRPGKGKPA